MEIAASNAAVAWASTVGSIRERETDRAPTAVRAAIPSVNAASVAPSLCLLLLFFRGMLDAVLPAALPELDSKLAGGSLRSSLCVFSLSLSLRMAPPAPLVPGVTFSFCRTVSASFSVSLCKAFSSYRCRSSSLTALQASPILCETSPNVSEGASVFNCRCRWKCGWVRDRNSVCV